MSIGSGASVIISFAAAKGIINFQVHDAKHFRFRNHWLVHNSASRALIIIIITRPSNFTSCHTFLSTVSRCGGALHLSSPSEALDDELKSDLSHFL
jgi:hypothetical protein